MLPASLGAPEPAAGPENRQFSSIEPGESKPLFLTINTRISHFDDYLHENDRFSLKEPSLYSSKAMLRQPYIQRQTNQEITFGTFSDGPRAILGPVQGFSALRWLGGGRRAFFAFFGLIGFEDADGTLKDISGLL